MTFRYFLDAGNDNEFSDTDEITADVLSAEWRIGLRNGGVRLADENVAVLVVNNSTGKYSPENSTSPLFGMIAPRKRLRIVYDDQPMWTGWLNLPQVTYAPMGASTGMVTATLYGVGGKQLLEQLPARLPLYSSVTADVVLGDIFSEELLPPTVADVWRLGDDIMSDLGDTTRVGSIDDFAYLDNGKFTFEVFGDTAHDDLWAVVQQLVTAERGYFLFNREGRAVFWNRHRVHAPNVPIATLTSDNTHAPQNVVYRYGEGLANEVWVECMPRKLFDESAELWSLDNPITLAPYQTMTLEARLRRDGGQYVGTQAGLIASIVPNGGDVGISLTPMGSKALIHLENTTNRTTTITSLSLNGTPSARQNMLAVMAQEAISQAQFGRFGMKIRLNAPASATEIRDIAQYEVLERAYPKGKVEKISYTESATQPNPQRLVWTVGSAITIDLAELSHNAEYIIIGEQHQVNDTAHSTQYILLQKPRPFWVLDGENYSELGINSWVGY